MRTSSTTTACRQGQIMLMSILIRANCRKLSEKKMIPANLSITYVVLVARFLVCFGLPDVYIYKAVRNLYDTTLISLFIISLNSSKSMHPSLLVSNSAINAFSLSPCAPPRPSSTSLDFKTFPNSSIVILPSQSISNTCVRIHFTE